MLLISFLNISGYINNNFRNPAGSKVKFGSGNNNLQVRDTFEKTLGFRHTGSKQLEEFKFEIPKEAGQSTPPNNCGGYWLKSSLNTPLSTSGVHNCAVCVAVSQKKNEHFLYHVLANSSPKSIEKVLKKAVGKDLEKAFIIPGYKDGTQVTSDNIAKAIKAVNRKCSIEYRHTSTEFPEIVSYNSEVYEIPRKPENTLTQASFEVIENSDYAL